MGFSMMTRRLRRTHLQWEFQSGIRKTFIDRSRRLYYQELFNFLFGNDNAIIIEVACLRSLVTCHAV